MPAKKKPAAKPKTQPKPSARKPAPEPMPAFSAPLAVELAVNVAWHNYSVDHPAAVRGLRSAHAMLAQVEGLTIERLMSDPEFALFIRQGRMVERDTAFWTRVVTVAGELIPQLLTRFVP